MIFKYYNFRENVEFRLFIQEVKLAVIRIINKIVYNNLQL